MTVAMVSLCTVYRETKTHSIITVNHILINLNVTTTSKNFTLIAKYWLVLGTDLRVISQSFLTQINYGPYGRLTQMSN